MNEFVGISFWIDIVCVDLATDEIDWKKSTDFNNAASRAWLSKTMNWAWTHGKSLEIYNQRDSHLIGDNVGLTD